MYQNRRDGHEPVGLQQGPNRKRRRRRVRPNRDTGNHHDRHGPDGEHDGRKTRTGDALDHSGSTGFTSSLGEDIEGSSRVMPWVTPGTWSARWSQREDSLEAGCVATSPIMFLLVPWLHPASSTPVSHLSPTPSVSSHSSPSCSQSSSVLHLSGHTHSGRLCSALRVLPGAPRSPHLRSGRRSEWPVATSSPDERPPRARGPRRRRRRPTDSWRRPGWR